MIPKAQSMICEVIQFIIYDFFIDLIPSLLIERQKHMAHGAGIYRKVRKPQADQLIYPLFYHIKVLLISCRFIGLSHSIIGHTAGPVPGHIHVHGALCHFIHSCLKLSLIVVQFHFPFLSVPGNFVSIPRFLSILIRYFLFFYHYIALLSSL